MSLPTFYAHFLRPQKVMTMAEHWIEELHAEYADMLEPAGLFGDEPVDVIAFRIHQQGPLSRLALARWFRFMETRCRLQLEQSGVGTARRGAKRSG